MASSDHKTSKKATDRASAAAMFLEELIFTAEQLVITRKEIAGREKVLKDETAYLLKKRSDLKSKVLNAFKILGLKSIKNKAGDSFLITHRPAFVFRDHDALEKWAVERKLYTLDDRKIHIELMREHSAGKLPAFAQANLIPTIAMIKKSRKKLKKQEEVEL